MLDLIEGEHQSPSFNIHINGETQEQINKSIILIGRNLSADKVNRIISNTHVNTHNLAKLSYKGKVGWDSRLDNVQIHVPEEDASLVLTDNEHLRRHMHIVQCPACDKQSPSDRYTFQYQDLDSKIKCIECSKHTAIRGWKCNCGIHWYNCRVHCCTESLPKCKPKASKVRTETTSGSLGSNAPYEQILDDDLKIEAKRAKRQLARQNHMVRPNQPSFSASMLSPNLRQRFAHLF